MTSSSETGRAAVRGRPRSTTREELARIALELFARDGFEATTVDDIAQAAGVGRRTLFHYYPSKNDMVWGDFDWVLDRLRAEFAAAPRSKPFLQALADAVVESNRYEADAQAELRIRMRLITTSPALQAHSMLRYEAWRDVVAQFAAERLEQPVGSLLPQVVAHTALAASMSAFATWVDDPAGDLLGNLRRAFAFIGAGLGADFR